MSFPFAGERARVPRVGRREGRVGPRRRARALGGGRRAPDERRRVEHEDVGSRVDAGAVDAAEDDEEVAVGRDARPSGSQLVGADGSANPFPCDGTLPDCVGEYDGLVVVEGPLAVNMAAPLVCDVETGECLSDLCFVVDCGVGGICVSPHETCTCSNGYSGDRCEVHTCCLSR